MRAATPAHLISTSIFWNINVVYYSSWRTKLDMSAIVRSRFLSIIFKNNRCFSSSTTVNPPKEPIVSTSSLLNDQSMPPPTAPLPLPPPPPPPPPPATSGSEKKSWNFFKYGLIAALTGGVATAGYATYAYTLDEVDEKTQALRASANYTIGDDVSALNKFQALLRSAAMTDGDIIKRGQVSYNQVQRANNSSLSDHTQNNFIRGFQVPAKLVELYLDLRRSTEEQVRGFTEPASDKLLPDLHPMEQHVFTLVLDLNETLIYSDWKRDRGWRTFKRPGVDDFLEDLAQFYEIVVYSDQMNMYVDPTVDRLDPKHCIRYRLNRAHTRYQDGKHYRDLSMLNRDPSRILYVSGNALESSLQPENCVPIRPWKGEGDDTSLVDLIPFLKYVAHHRPPDIRPVLASYQGHDISKEFIERSKGHQRRMQEQKQHGRFWRR